MTNKELAIAIAEEFDDGFTTKAEFAEGVLDIYNCLERGYAIQVFDMINREIENRNYVDIDNLTDLLFAVRERL